MDKLTTPISYATSASMTILGGLTINDWLAVTGIVLGIATFAVNWFYKHKQSKQAGKTRKGNK